MKSNILPNPFRTNIQLSKHFTLLKCFSFVLLGMFTPDVIQGYPLIDNVDIFIQKAINNYFENVHFNQNDSKYCRKAFVYCNFYGTNKLDDNTCHVFVRCVCHSYFVRYNQIFESMGSNGQYIIRLKTFQNKYDIQIVDPKDPPKSDDNFRKIVPKEYHDKMFDYGKDEHLFPQKQECKNRILEYYMPLLSENRSFYKKPPSKQNDIHNHDENIYGYLNLRDAYDYTSIKLIQSDSVKGQSCGDAFSPDRRFRIWVGAERKFHLYYEDKRTKKIYEIVNLAGDMLMKRAWKDKKTLIFDQINGYGRYDTVLKSSNHHFGVHFEIDLEQRKIIWAVPIGDFSFPEKIESSYYKSK